jgi:hypothetical protein
MAENMPICESHERGQCPKSDVILLAEHGTPQATWYTTFKCKTCKTLFVKYNPAIVDRAKRGLPIGSMGDSLANPRFQGLNK